MRAMRWDSGSGRCMAVLPWYPTSLSPLRWKTAAPCSARGVRRRGAQSRVDALGDEVFDIERRLPVCNSKSAECL
eukprot:4822196-Pyramimonas_sp.AAC.1